MGEDGSSTVKFPSEVCQSIPFDERYPLAAGEDRDWCARLADAGHPRNRVKLH